MRELYLSSRLVGGELWVPQSTRASLSTVRAVFRSLKPYKMLISTPFTISLYYLVPQFWCLPSSARTRFENEHSSCQNARSLALRRTAMSPYRQSAFRGVFSGYLFHGARRLAANAPYFVPPFAAGKPAFSTHPLAIAIAMH